MLKPHRIVLLMGAIALILVILALQLLIAGGRVEKEGPDQAHIRLSADRGMVVAPGDCVTVRWQADHIQALYIDGEATVGIGFKRLCVDAQTMPVLHVVYADGSSADVSLKIQFLVEQPVTWILASLVLLLVLVSLYISITRPATHSGSRRAAWTTSMFAGIGLWFSAILGLLLLGELGLRFYFEHFGTPDEVTAYLESRQQLDSRQSDLMILPFLEYGPSPDYPGHNRLGYRGEEIQVPKPDGVYRIVALGDSSTYGSFSAYNQTYPYDLQNVLRVDYGNKNVEVVNAGVVGYTSWSILVDLAFRVAALQPDLVIVYADWNDLDARELSSDCYSTPSPFLGLDPHRQLRAQPADLSPSALYRFLTINFGWMEKPVLLPFSLVDSPIPCASPANPDKAQNIHANSPVYFERNLHEIISVAKVLGVKMMFMSWAYNANNPDFPAYRHSGIGEHNAITERIAQEGGALFFDYAAVAPTDEQSWEDVAHLSIAGNLEMAQIIAKFLVGQQVIPPSPAS